MKIYVEEESSSSSSVSSFLVLAKNDKNHSKIQKILKKIEPYLVEKQHIIDIYSKEGIYQVNDNTTYKLYIKSEKIHDDIILQRPDDKTVTLIIDDSIIEKEITHQIPFEHVNIPLTIHRYSLNSLNKKVKNNSHGLVLVIEFIDTGDKENMRPINYYFEHRQPNNAKFGDGNNIPTEDINVFLSLLN
jgi:hypothetical protein